MACCVVLAACSTKHYKKSADTETAAVIAQKSPVVPNMDPKFSIEASEKTKLDDLPVSNEVQEFFGPDAGIEKGAQVISLEKALDLAVKHSRTYQNRKELLYLQALGLTLDRHRYTPIFGGGGSAQQTTTQIESGVDNLVDERRVTTGQNAGVDQLMRAGTRIATDFSTDFLRYVTGDPRAISSSALVGTLSQPLLRGAGSRIASENLTQSERNLLYGLRDFSRFRKEFSVDIASAYYNVLQNRDVVRNSWRGFQNFKSNVERERASAEIGRKSQASLNQLKQAELQTETRWINAVRVYRQSLDSFKIQLGLPTDVHVILDDKELDQLQINHPKITTDDAVQVALVSRLDLETERDQLIDAERHIKVAKNSFLPQLDVVTGASVDGRQTSSGFTSPDFSRYRWNAGFNLDLPFDRKSQRNNYRASLIAFERAKRELELAVDNIKLQISDDWRNLDQAKRNYEISEVGVQIAESRVEEQRMRQELDRASARDLIDAQNDLIESKNQLTSALVSHTIAKLRFWRDMGILFIKEDGQWEEMRDDENTDE